MPALPANAQELVRFHLGYSDAAPVGAHALLNDRMSNLTAGRITLIQQQIARITKTWEESESDAQDSGIEYRRVITGDVNRTDIEYRAESWQKRRRIYIWECSRLALHLGVKNFNGQNEDELYYGVNVN